MEGFSQEAMVNGQQIVDAMVAASQDLLGLTEEDVSYFISYNYEVGTTVYRILESLLEAVCVLLAVAPVRMKKTGERCYLRPGMRLLATRSEFRMRVKAVERSAVPDGVLAHILPLVQMLAVVPLGVDVPRAGLCLREWAISMSDFHNAKAQGDAEAAALDRLMQARVRRGGKAAAAATAAPSPKGSVSPR
eukprot:Rhum_TRINITY_DN23875_c0_g1::Rhum_TRINITY_DN23875_c0_g1_i1::g.178895::m.178895